MERGEGDGEAGSGCHVAASRHWLGGAGGERLPLEVLMNLLNVSMLVVGVGKSSGRERHETGTGIDGVNWPFSHGYGLTDGHEWVDDIDGTL